VLDFINIDFPNTTSGPERLQNLTFYQERGAHELAIATFKDWNISHDAVKQGTPVTLTIKGDVTDRIVNGYVHHVKRLTTPGAKITEVGIIGASYHLKQQRQKVYKNVSASDVIKDIANYHGFAFNVEDHPRIYDQISQAGESDLEFCNKLAKQCGYSLRFQNTEIHFQPVLKHFDEMKDSALSFQMSDQASPGGSTIYSFMPIVGETLEQNGEYKAAVAVSGVDKFTGQLIQVTNQKRPKASRKNFEPEFFDRFDSITVANNYEVAKNESISADERVRFPYKATAEVVGNPDLYPDCPVYLEGVGDEYSGFWTVLKTEHKVTLDTLLQYKYTTILHLGTDSLGLDTGTSKNPAIGSPAGARKRKIIPGVKQTNRKPVTVLKAGTKSPTKKGPVGFGKVNNRPRPVVAKKVIVASKWKNTSKSLKTVTKKTSPSPVVLAHLRTSRAK
jgi:hypothetical protein